QKDQLRAQSIRTLNDSIARLGRRLDAIQAKRDAEREAAEQEEAKRKADAKAAVIKAALDNLQQHEEFEGGELTTHPPATPRHEAQLAASGDQGELPAELTKDVPPDPGTYGPSLEDPEQGCVQPQPVAIEE